MDPDPDSDRQHTTLEATFENPATAWSPRTLHFVRPPGATEVDMQAFKKTNCVSSVCLKSLRLLFTFLALFFGNLFCGAGRRKLGQLAFPLVGLAELERLRGGAGGGVVLPHQAHRPLHQAQPGHLH
jgi:hypothetical protein